jgi:hypothetical protein
VYKLVSANRGASNNQAISFIKDAKSGRRSGCHILFLALRSAFVGNRSETAGTYFHIQGFKRASRGGRAGDVDIVIMCNDLHCGVCCSCELEGVLEREGEKEGSEGVPLFNAT